MGSQNNLALLNAKVEYLEKSFDKFRSEISHKLEIIEKYFTYQHEVSKKQSLQDQMYFNNFVANWKKLSATTKKAISNNTNLGSLYQFHQQQQQQQLHQKQQQQREEQQQRQQNQFLHQQRSLQQLLSKTHTVFPATTILQQMLNSCNNQQQSILSDLDSTAVDPLSLSLSGSGQETSSRNGHEQETIADQDQCGNNSNAEDNGNQNSQDGNGRNDTQQSSNESDNEYEDEDGSVRIETEADPRSFFGNDDDDDSGEDDMKQDDNSNNQMYDQNDGDQVDNDSANGNSKTFKQENSSDTNTNGFHNFESTSEYQGEQQQLPVSTLGFQLGQLRPVHNGKLLCNICHSYFHRNSLRRHMRVVHFTVPKSKRISLSPTTTVNRLIIPRASTSSTSTNNTNTSLRPLVGRLRANNYECDVCRPSVIFATSSLLVDHVTSFHNTTPISCESCDLVFVVYQNFKHHQLISGHGAKFSQETDGKRRVKCLYCPRSYQTRADLVVHMRSHTGEKPFKCDVCRKSFSDIRNMKRHKLRCNGYNYGSILPGTSLSSTTCTPIIVNSHSLYTAEGRFE